MTVKDIIHLFGPDEHFRLTVFDRRDKTVSRQADITLRQLRIWGDCEVRFIVGYDVGTIALFLYE